MELELFSTLETLVQTFGPSGQEGEVSAAIRALAQPYGVEARTDVMGNLILRRPGPGPRVLLAAHMDSLGLMVTHIEDSGLLRVGKLGGIEPRLLPGTAVRFRGGVTGVIYEDEGLEEKRREPGHLYVDIGAKDGEAAKKMVQIGDAAVWDGPVRRGGGAIFGPYLDDRVGCAALLRALSLVKGGTNDLYFVFTVQEEVGLRGAAPAAFAIDPDYAVTVDVTDSADVPGAGHAASAKWGGGAAIKVMDRSVICHPWMVERLTALAKAGDIPHQMEIMADGGTDAGAIHKSRAGVCTGGISIPCRYVHAPQEGVWADDVEACVRLLAAFAQDDLPPIFQEGV